MARLTSWLAAAALFGSCASLAAPVPYTLTFDGSAGNGPNGTGTFTYDSVTQQGSGLSWNFGGGETGGVFDSLFTSNPSFAAFLFDRILKNLTDDPATVGTAFTPSDVPGATFGPFGEDAVAFCWGQLSSSCEMANPGISLASYRFHDRQGDGGPVYRGYVTIDAVVEVPEPPALALVLLAALAAGIVPAWARRAATSARPQPPRP